MEKKHFKRMILVGRLLISLLLTLLILPWSAGIQVFAADSVEYYKDDQGNDTYPKKIVIKPYTYSAPDAALGIGKELNQDALNKIAGNAMTSWAPLAYNTFKWGSNQGGTYSGITSNIPTSSEWTDYFSADDASTPLKINLEEWLAEMSPGHKGSARNHYTLRTGSRTTNSLKNLRLAMGGELKTVLGTDRFSAEEFLEKGGGGEKGALNALDDDKARTVYYNIVTHLNNSSKYEYYYNSYGIAVYDFELTAIVDKDVPYKDAVTEDDPSGNNETSTFTSNSENKSRQESNVSMELTESTTQSVSNSITNSQSLSFTETIGNEFQFGENDGFFKDVLKIEVSSTQTIQTAYTDQKTVSATVSNSLSASTALPPHTSVELIQSSGDENKIVTYTCPVALRYKVAFFSMSGHAHSDDAYDNQINGTRSNFSTVFGTGKEDGGYGAPENLYKRAVQSFEAGDYNPSSDMSYGQVHGWYSDNEIRNTMPWDTIIGNNDDLRALAEKLGTSIPLFGQGASLKVSFTGKDTEIGEIKPLYTLTQIRQEEGENQYELTSGDTLNLGGLKVGGYNEYDVPFYGFNRDEGGWVLCDSGGNVLADSTVAAIDKNTATGRCILTAKNPGEVYIKWVLSDKASYTSVKGENEPVTARENPPASPLVQILVKEAPVDLSGYHIEAKKEASMLPGESLDLNAAFSPEVYDDNDILISRAVKFEPQDQTGSPDFSISGDGVFTAVKAGTYKVHACYTKGSSKVTSGWLNVIVKPAPALSYMTVIDPEEKKITSSVPEQKYDLASFVSYFDQYDNPWTGTVNAGFELPEGTDGASIENGILTVQKGGTYPVTVSAAGLESRMINVVVNSLGALAVSDDADVLKTFISGDTDNKVDLSRLTVKGTDQNNKDWDMQDSDVTWYVDDNAIAGNIFTAPANNSESDKVYTIRAGSKAGTADIYSNSLTLTVRPERKLATLTIAGPVTEEGLGIGSGYALDLKTDITVTGHDQYKKSFELNHTTLSWTSDNRYSEIIKVPVFNNTLLVGKAEGRGSLYAETSDGSIQSNMLQYDVLTKPFVDEFYADDGGTILEGEAFSLKNVKVTARDQDGKDYKMSRKEIDSIQWAITDGGTIKPGGGVTYDPAAATITVAEGTLKYGDTGTVLVSGTFTNPDKSMVNGTFTIFVEQKPILDKLTLALKDETSVIPTKRVKFCMDHFAVTGTDQYKRAYDLTNEALTFASDNEEAYRIDKADDKNKCTITAGNPDTTANITVTGRGGNTDVVSNSVKLHVPSVRKLTSVEFTRVPDTIPLETEYSMADLHAVCFDQNHEAFTQEELEDYPAKVTYSLDKGSTQADLDAARNILKTGGKRGFITVSAHAVNADTASVIKDKAGNDIKTGTQIWTGPRIEIIKASKTAFHAKGGTAEITFSGKALSDGIEVYLLDNNGKVIQTAVSSGSDTGQAASLKVPDNTSLTASGIYTVEYCVCGDYQGSDEFAPEAGITITVENHTLKMINRMEASCETNGNIQYWICAKCNKCFKDPEAKEEISKESTVIKAFGHNWDHGKIRAAKSSGSGLITYTCIVNAAHKKSSKIPVLLTKMTSAGAKEVTFTWNREPLADGYDIFFSKCNQKDHINDCKLTKTINNPSVVKWKKTGLNKGTVYKGYVKAWRKNGEKKQYIAAGYMTHCIAGNSNKYYTNAKKVKVRKNSFVIKKGKSKSVNKTSMVKISAGRKLITHEPALRYATSDSRIAEVSDKGKIKAVGKGTCSIYVLTNNGIRAKIKVKVIP